MVLILLANLLRAHVLSHDFQFNLYSHPKIKSSCEFWTLLLLPQETLTEEQLLPVSASFLVDVW